MNHLPFLRHGLLKHTFRFKMGGGGGGAPTVTSTPPPPTQQSVEIQDAQRDARKQAAKRKGLNQTILAGETGGYQPTMGNTGSKPTVLGGV
jgi:hypothetical protein